MNSVINILKSDFARNQCRNLEKKLGTSCFKFLEENQVVLFIMTQMLLFLERRLPSGFKANCIDYAFILAPATKAFEGYLKKLIKENDLWEQNGDDIGIVFGGKKKDKVYTKLRNDDYDITPKVILAEWNRCRNRILHYNKTFFVKTAEEAGKIYERMLDIIKESYEAYVDDSPYVSPFIKAYKPPEEKTEQKPTDGEVLDAMRKRLSGRYPDDENGEKLLRRYPRYK